MSVVLGVCLAGCAPPRPAALERPLPSSGALSVENAFGGEIMIPGAYADAAARDADKRDGVLEVEVVDAEDGTPVKGARVSCRGADSGTELTLQADERGVVRFEAAPAVWLALIARDGEEKRFARRHDPVWKFVHGPCRVQLAMKRTSWLRFRVEPFAGVAPPELVSIQYERQGSEGLDFVVPSLAGSWSLSAEHPRAIALPEGPCRLRFTFESRSDVPSVLLTDVAGGGDERVIRLRECVPVVGRVVQGDQNARGEPLYPDASIEIELRRRSGRTAIESVRIGGDGMVRRSTPHSESTESSLPAVASARRADPNGPWEFRSPPFVPGAAFEVIARARIGDEVIACGTLENGVAGGPVVAVPLLPAATIHGVVRDATGAPLTTPVGVTATWACEDVSPGAVLAATETREDGTFELVGLPRVPVRVQAGGAFHGVYTPEPVETIAGERETVTLDTRPTLNLTGTLRDAATGRPVACHLKIQQETTRSGGQGFASHGNGRWNFHGLVPGRMRLVVSFGSQFLGEIEPVTITESTTELLLRLP